MSEFRFILNNVELNDHPDGWGEFNESFELDRDVWGFVLKYEGELTFHGDGWKILSDLWDNSSCSKIPIEVLQRCASGQWETAFTGILTVNDCDFNLEKCLATVSTTDSSWYGRIHNDRQIPINLQADISKGKVPITPAPVKDLRVFNPATAVTASVSYSGTIRKAFDHRDALAHMLAFVTDNEINAVASDFLDNLTWDNPPQDIEPDFEYTDMSFMIVRGQNFREGGDQSTITTIETVLQTLHMKYNLWWHISDGVFRIEPEEYWRGGVDREYPWQPDLIRSVDTSLLYAKVAIGSKTDLPDNKIDYAVPFVDLISHDVQEYALEYKCNTDTVLDLISDLVYSSNVFERTINEADQGEDQENFYIQAVYVPEDDQWRAVYTTTFLRPNPGDDDFNGIAYNPFLFNNEVLTRHLLPAGLFIYEADTDDNFKAEATENYQEIEVEEPAPPTGVSLSLQGPMESQAADWIASVWGEDPFGVDTPNPPFLGVRFPSATLKPLAYGDGNISPVEYPLEIYDQNDNWNNTVFEFTCPATGIYGFRARTIINKVLDVVRVFATDFPINVSPFGDQYYLHDPRIQVDCVFERYDATDELLQAIQAVNVTETPTSNSWSEVDGAGIKVQDTPGYQDGFNIPFTVDSTHYTAKAMDIGQRWDNDKTHDYQALMYMSVNDVMKVRINIRFRQHFGIDKFKSAPIFGTAYRKVAYGVLAGSTLETNFIVSGGDDFSGVDPNLAYNGEYAFDRPVTFEDWKFIRSNPQNAIGVGVADILNIGGVKKISRNFTTTQTEFQLSANRNDQP